MLTYHFKELDKEQVEFLKNKIDKGHYGLIYDLLQDSETLEWDMLVEEQKASTVNDFLDKIGVDPK